MEEKSIDLGDGAWFSQPNGHFIIGNLETTTVLTPEQFRRLIAKNVWRVMKGDKAQEDRVD